MGKACLITLSESGLPHWTWSVRLKSTPARTQTHDCIKGPSQATPSLLIGVVLSTLTDMWVEVINTGYDGMPTSLGKVWMQIRCLGQGSVADKPHTSWCPSESVADITDFDHFWNKVSGELFFAFLCNAESPKVNLWQHKMSCHFFSFPSFNVSTYKIGVGVGC